MTTKVTYLLAVALLVLSCEKSEMTNNNFNDTQDLSRKPQDVMLVDASYNLNALTSNCDLSNYEFQDFTTNVQWYTDLSDQFTPLTGGYNQTNYGVFPSNNLGKSLTAIFNYNNEFLPYLPPPGPINPVTGNPYYRTVLNNYYNSYSFIDTGYYNVYGDLIFDYINGETSSNNELKNILACKILDIASQVDPTAFIIDLGINMDSSSCNNCNDYRAALIYIKWGYHK